MQHYAGFISLSGGSSPERGRSVIPTIQNTEFMKKLLDSRYAEKVLEIPGSEHATSDQARTKHNAWYIPHHGVYHPKKPDKIRVVFDYTAEYESESLNKHLL